MNRRKTIIAAVASGFVWAAIAWGVAYSMSPIGTTRMDVLRMFAGGIVFAPAIGMLITRMSHSFIRYGGLRRAVVSLGHLYFAVFLFLLATGVGRLVFEFRGPIEQMAFRALVQDPILGTLLGVTYTGYVLVLWPLSYLTHLLVAGALNGPRPSHAS